MHSAGSTIFRSAALLQCFLTSAKGYECYLPPDTVHGAGLKVHQHGPRHVLGSARLGVVHVDPLQLAEEEVRMVGEVEMMRMETMRMEMMEMIRMMEMMEMIRM